jgi:hypothetical protein
MRARFAADKGKAESFDRGDDLQGKFKFWSDTPMIDPKIKEADGNLSTCIKFDVSNLNK